ncbi:MAG: RluA family pseudouridine synthase [Planctomycetaceae bacterium]
MPSNVSPGTCRAETHNTYTLDVDDYLHGTRVDKFLTRHFRNYTAFRMQRLVRSGMVLVNHKQAVTNTRVFLGQIVRVRLLEPPDKLFIPESIPLDIVYEDEWLLIVNKPAGLITHPVSDIQSGTLCNALQFHLDQQSPVRGILRPGIIHRLDRMTSGLLVVSKQHLAHRSLSIAFQERHITKSYLALVKGVVDADQGTIDTPIGRVSRQNSILMSSERDSRNAKSAATNFRVQRRWPHATLLLATPLTGRLHQVRVHLAHRGHPVVGDPFYTTGPASTQATEVPSDAPPKDGTQPTTDLARESRHLLHASELAFRHPITEEWMRFSAPATDDFMQSLQEWTKTPEAIPSRVPLAGSPKTNSG